MIYRWVPAGTLVPMGTGVPLAPTPGYIPKMRVIVCIKSDVFT